MFLILAFCAGLTAYALGWDPICAWMFADGSSTRALQAALPAGLFLGLMGTALSFDQRHQVAAPFIALGVVATVGLMAEDIMGVRAIGASGWSNDLLNLGQRAGLLVLFFSRFTPAYRRTSF